MSVPELAVKGAQLTSTETLSVQRPHDGVVVLHLNRPERQKVLHDVSPRALQIHGSLGTSHEMPFVQYLTESFVLGLADGPTEVHKVTLARLLLKNVEPAPDTFPSEHILRLRHAAEENFADKLAGLPRG